MTWLTENYAVIVFLLTTLLSAIIALLKHFGKRKTAQALEKVKEMLHQTFGNVEALKVKWKKSGMEEKYGHIGEIFARINEEASAEEILKTAYAEWQKEREADWKPAKVSEK